MTATASSTQEAMIEDATENEISSYENYLKRKRNSLPGDIPSEYGRYLSLPMLSSNADVFEFWKSRLMENRSNKFLLYRYVTLHATFCVTFVSFFLGYVT